MKNGTPGKSPKGGKLWNEQARHQRTDDSLTAVNTPVGFTAKNHTKRQFYKVVEGLFENMAKLFCNLVKESCLPYIYSTYSLDSIPNMSQYPAGKSGKAG